MTVRGVSCSQPPCSRNPHGVFLLSRCKTTLSKFMAFLISRVRFAPEFQFAARAPFALLRDDCLADADGQRSALSGQWVPPSPPSPRGPPAPACRPIGRERDELPAPLTQVDTATTNILRANYQLLLSPSEAA